jgi:hypothetical protein
VRDGGDRVSLPEGLGVMMRIEQRAFSALNAALNALSPSNPRL